MIKRQISTGILLGIIAGFLDLIPMVIQKLPWNANLSAFIMWVVVGFLVSLSELPVINTLKGLIIANAVLFPNIFIIGAKDPISVIPILIMITILGSLLGYTYGRIKEK
jgi:hypothetical protein